MADPTKSPVTIDRALNLVMEIETPHGMAVVHSTPVSRDVFRMYYREIAGAFAAIHNDGLGITAGPRVASLMLEDVAKQLGSWEAPPGAGAEAAGRTVKSGLLAEIRRLTNAIVPSPQGPQRLPWQQIVDQKLMDAEDIDEVENAIVFFTVGSFMYPRSDRETMLRGAAKLWNARIESSGFSDLQTSSTTSTAGGRSGGKATR